MNQNLKIIKTVFMPGQKKGKKVYGEQEGKRGIVILNKSGTI